MARTARPPSVIRQQRSTALRRDPNALVGSAALMTGAGASSAKITNESWQEVAWSYYDIGELRAAVTWKANALSRVNLVCAIPPLNQGDEPTPVNLETHPELKRQVELVAEIAGGVAGQGQLLAGCAKQLTVPGLGYILATSDDQTDSFSTWEVLSNDEVRKSQDTLQYTDPISGEWKELGPNDVLIKIWNAHPRRRHLPDSPTRGVLQSLAEIQLLSQRIASDATSRLAGNGLLILPTEVEFAPVQAGTDASNAEDSLTETLLQVTQIPIGDQSSPAAQTPLIIQVPGEWVKDIQHLTFYSDFDMNLEPLRQAAIRRLALGLDMPPDVLLGLGEANHWSAWQIADEAITMHVEPMAETICHALTVGFLQGALLAEGLEADSAIVWYDTSDLAARPDLSDKASEAHARLIITDDAYLGYLGLDTTDKLLAGPERTMRYLLQVVSLLPALAPVLLEAAGLITAEQAARASDALASASAPFGGGAPAPADTPTDPPPVDGPPATENDPPAANSDAILAAADGIIIRALERSGQRLRSSAGRRIAGGAASIAMPDAAALHCTISATEHASLDQLLEGAWDRVPTVADRYGVEPGSFAAVLDGYTRGLIAGGHPHTMDRLARALGIE